MKFTITNKTISKGLLVAFAAMLAQCTSPTGPEWQQKNDDLIAQYKLEKRELSGLPDNAVKSNLEPAKVAAVNSLDSAELYPGVKAKMYWGTGTMTCILQLA